jgi:CDP-6-deoxy-D-xylo-4-hexulose-3-dehydrase
VGGLPFGYDHKYIYSNIGYNLKVTDMQAAIGVAQIDKIPSIVAKRRRNFGLLMEGLKALEEHLVLPESEPLAAPSPFGFPLTVRGSVSRRDLVQYLEEAKIETRQLFGGNILRQPGFNNIRHRVHGELTNSDRVMTDTFFVGVYPRLNDDMIAYMIETFHKFFAR